jgi:hypothetical protein
MLAYPIELNFLNLLLVFLFFQYIGLLFIVVMTAVVSSYTKTAFTSLAISVGLFLVPQLLIKVFKTGIISKFLLFNPILTRDVEKTLLNLSTSDGFFTNNFMVNSLMIVIVLVLMASVGWWIICRNMKVRDGV